MNFDKWEHPCNYPNQDTALLSPPQSAIFSMPVIHSHPHIQSNTNLILGMKSRLRLPFLKLNIIIHFMSGLFAQYDLFEIHPCYSMFQLLIFVYCSVVVYWIDILNLFAHSFVGGHLAFLSKFFVILNLLWPFIYKCCWNICFYFSPIKT